MCVVHRMLRFVGHKLTSGKYQLAAWNDHNMVTMWRTLFFYNKENCLLYPPEAPRVERFSAFTKRKTTSARFTKFAGYLHWGVSFPGKEISLILKNKMAATGISLKIIYIFLLALSHR